MRAEPLCHAPKLQGLSYVHQDHEPVILYIRNTITPGRPGPIEVGLRCERRRRAARIP
jgi:hypothetical protein